MPTKALDDLTEIPEDVFEEFLKAGKEARQRGQHRLVKRTNAPNSICLYQSPRACKPTSPEPHSACDRLRLPGIRKVSKESQDERSTLASESDIRERIVGEQKIQCPPMVQRRIVQSHIGATVSGSAFRAASNLRRRRQQRGDPV